MQSMIIYLLIPLYLIFISISMGSIILNKLKYEKYISYASPIGYFFYLAVFQVFFYFLTVCRATSKIYLLSFIIINFAILIIILFNIKIVFKYLTKQFKKENLIKTIFITLFFFTCILLYTKIQFKLSVSDLNFYVPYIENRLSSTTFYIMYDYQAFYTIYSSFYNLIKIVFNVLGLYDPFLTLGYMTWIPSIVFYWIFACFSVEVFNIIVSKVKSKFSMLLVSSVIFTSFFLKFWFYFAPWVGNSLKKICISYLIYLLYRHYSNKVNDNNTKVLCLILFGSSIAVSTTCFFLSVILLYCSLVYSVWNNRVGYIKDLLLFSIFPVSYACVFNSIFIYIFGVIYLICIYILFTKNDEKLEKWINKYFKTAFIIIPIILAIISCVFFIGLTDSLNAFVQFDEYFDHAPDLFKFNFFNNEIFLVLYNIAFWIIIFIFLFDKKIKQNYIKLMVLIIFITFFNPFCYGIIFNLLTSVVYFRITDLFFNPIVLAMILINVLNKKKLIHFSYLLLVVLIISSLKTNRINNYIKNDDNHSWLYHTSISNIDFMNQFDNLILKESTDNDIRIVSQIESINLFSKYEFESVIGARFYTIDDPIFIDIFENKLDLDENQDESKFNNACYYANKEEIDYIIIDAQYNWQLESGLWSCVEKKFEFEQYRVFKTNYDYWEYNIREGYVTRNSNMIGENNNE